MRRRSSGILASSIEVAYGLMSSLWIGSSPRRHPLGSLLRCPYRRLDTIIFDRSSSGHPRSPGRKSHVMHWCCHSRSPLSSMRLASPYRAFYSSHECFQARVFPFYRRPKSLESSLRSAALFLAITQSRSCLHGDGCIHLSPTES